MAPERLIVMPSTIRDATLQRHHVRVGTDSAFQQRARLLQALWREQCGLPIGTHRGKPLGSRIDAGHARATLANFLTDGIREVVRHAVIGAGRTQDQLIDEDRLFSNLLSSQPLCFNLFGELARDLDLSTRVFHELAPERVERVLSIAFEYSPGRGDLRFTGDRSAFDVFVTYDSPGGKRGFLGIEVKYHEALGDPAAEHRPRYDAVADAMGCFVAERDALKEQPLQQIWRDHLLAGALVAANVGFDEGRFVFLAPEGNSACWRAIASYRERLVSDDSLVAWTLEAVIRAVRAATSAPWVDELAARYVGLEAIDRLVQMDAAHEPSTARCTRRARER